MSTPTPIRRPRAVAASLLALSVASALAAGQAAPKRAADAARPREAAVLAVLGRELDGRRPKWFWLTRMVRRPEHDGGHIALEDPNTCGTSTGGNLDPARAQDLIAKLGAAFGAKAPFEIDPKLLPMVAFDSFTPLAAVAVEAVERLNAASEGEDVDLSLLESGSIDVWPLPTARDAAGHDDAKIVAGGAARLERARKLRFDVRADAKGAGAAKRGRETEVAGAVRPTAGHVALLFVPILPTTDLAGTGMPTFTLHVKQGDVAADSTSALVWLPSTFDARQPFTVEVALGPGVWSFGEQLFATAPDR